MAHNLKCPDCGHPVGWDVNGGECPRNMQNYQSDDCKARQIAWLKAQRDAALGVVKVADASLGVDDWPDYQEAREVLDRMLKGPA